MSEKTKFSYSKLNTYENCPFRFKLQYIDKHFCDTTTIANEFGTLIHYVEETMAQDIMQNSSLSSFDVEKYIDLFININKNEDNKTVVGASALKRKYPEEFVNKDKSGLSYEDKANDYLNFGIYRLWDFMKSNPEYEIVDVEHPFNVEYGDYVFHGFIDRILRNKTTGEYVIQDLKTWSSIEKGDLTTPLQFVIYMMAAKELYPDASSIRCQYDLPLAHETYDAGTKGFETRGLKKIDKLFGLIDEENFDPKPSPLCHFCPYSCNSENAELVKENYLCPYFMHWTRDNKDFSVEYPWMGMENHEAILAEHLKKYKKDHEPEKKVSVEGGRTKKDPERRFFILRY